MAALLSLSLLAGCAGGGQSSTAPGSSGAGGGASQTPSSSAPSGERVHLTFWYHDGNQISTDTYEPIMENFNQSQEKYTAEYIGIPVDSYLQKVNVAIATNTLPDTIDVRTSDVVNFSTQNAIIPLDDAFASWDEAQYVDAAVVEFVKTLGGGKLYAIPACYNMDICWYNTQKFAEKGIAGPPATIDEFLSDCEQYADPKNGEYFYSMRGSDPINNMVNFVFTYADATDFFDSEGNCVLGQPQFVEGLEKYVSIYKNGWVSQNSVTNGYKEIVAEFASGSSMFLNHNSSSLPDHLKNLGEGNFAPARFPANSQGRYVFTVSQPQSYGVCPGKNEEGGILLVEFLCNEQSVSSTCDILGRLPAHSKVYEHEWYKSNKYLDIYAEISKDPNAGTVALPLWLPEYSEFRNQVCQTGLQAAMLGEKTCQQVCEEWAEYLTTAQKAYLAA